MGTKNIDRLPFEGFRRNAETVAQMQAAGWSVIAKCDTCRVALDVNLAFIAKASGPDTSLWNRRQRCKVVGCSGWVDFLGRHPRRASHEPLRAPWPEGVPARRTQAK
ncbi:hypothetical protein M9M90_15750 [Phenylobacterium sp. LH3H17]|uniref:hypothetical protein n=1 Tax=Phenylobacterium sp. LH3H17 TaxID=2903901 RepID=UPI0020C9E418|nr:hypothetical protein [Phenylobacterium sp. LH3H17]UTP38665.1 hypothetical protein M9M90_15750 [Phenylobacterium sp. LH3H17]